MEDKLTLKCSCGHVIIEITKDSYKYTNEHSVDIRTSDYYLSFYHYAVNRSFWLRLNRAWKYLIKGEKILLDDILLREEDVNKLTKFLNEKFN